MPEDDEMVQHLEVTLWVGKAGIEAVTDELANQLGNREAVKVKFLRSARGTESTTTLATELASTVDGELVTTRGNTAVYQR